MPLYVRPALPEDESFVYQLVRQVIYDQLLGHLWDPTYRDALLDLQVRAKAGSYAVIHPHADHAIIMLDDDRVGRLLIDRTGPCYDLVDISILPKYRSGGIGTRIILGLCMEAEMMQKNVRLYVSITNPRAIELYKRLGFRVVEDRVTDLLMEKTPADRAQVLAAP
jgi:ribosomal protein S18 acetylase RimI-like enzyme